MKMQKLSLVATMIALGSNDSVAKVLKDEETKLLRLKNIKEDNEKRLSVEEGLHTESSAKEQKEISELLNRQLREREELKGKHKSQFKDRVSKINSIKEEIESADKHITRLTY